MGNKIFKDEKTKPQSHYTNQTTANRNNKQMNAFPKKMAFVKTMIDPFNHKNYYIFGSVNNNQCWYFNHETQSFNEISDIPKDKTQGRMRGHNCAMFATINNDNKYALFYGGQGT